MYTLVAIFVSLLCIITLVIFLFTRTYDTLSDIQQSHDQKNKRTIVMQNALETKFNSITSDNKTEISLNKEHIRTYSDQLQDLKHQLKQIEVDLNTKVNDLSVESEEDFFRLYEADGDLKKTLSDMDADMKNELNILTEKVHDLQDEVMAYVDDVNGYQVDFNEFKKQTDSELAPMKESVSKLMQQVSSNMILVADYVINYDKVTRRLKVEDPSNAEGTDGIHVNNAYIHRNGKINITSDNMSSYEISATNNLNIELPDNISALQIRTKNSGITSHSFSGDGYAVHSGGLEVPYLKVGKYIFVEDEDGLKVRDADNMDNQWIVPISNT